MLALLLCACDNHDGPENPQDTRADYTVIFWGMCGTNDGGVAVDMLSLANYYVNGAIGSNVEIAGLMKTSVNLSDESAAAFDATYYFESGDMTGKTIDVDAPETVSEAYEMAFSVLNGSKYADTSYPLNNTDSLAAFIKRVDREHPAKHYVLMLLGHGGGFSPAEEAPLTTKACLYDNYCNSAYLTADAVVSAVQKSGVEIQTIFTQCCLMATLENIAAYSQVFDYGILAAEVTYSGYFPMYPVLLSAAGDDKDQFEANSKGLIDYYISALDAYPDTYTSHGFYDLTKAPELLSVVEDIASWYNTNYSKLTDPIEEAMGNCIFCDNLNPGEDSIVRKERAVLQAILADEDVSSMFEGAGSGEDIFREIINMMIDLNYHAISYGFPFTHVLSCTVDELEAVGNTTEKAALEDLTTQFVQALTDMAYIRATAVPDGAGAEYPYIYTAPTINIFALNEQYFRPLFGTRPQEALNELMTAFRNDDEAQAISLMEELFGGTPFAAEVSLETALNNYTSSVFDRQVKWSSFLKQLQMNPSVIYNPDRGQVNGK